MPEANLTADELKAIITAAVKEALRDQPIKLDPEHPVKIDVGHIFRQLNDAKVDSLARHYFMYNNRWARLLMHRSDRAAKDTYDFIDANMRDAVFAFDQFAIIEDRKDSVNNLNGRIIDLGVYKGKSTRALARIFPKGDIHGFDSFEGLPEDWSHAKKGTFGDAKGVLPEVPAHVKLHKGWFDDTLPKWAAEHKDKPISLLRVDCDIYSSTKTIFDVLGPLLVDGTWICFDELIGYYGWQDHEHKAFMEFIEQTGFKYRYVGYGLTYTLAQIYR